MSAPVQAYSIGDAVPPGVRRLHLNEFRFEHHPDVLAACAAAGPDELSQYAAGPDAALTRRLEDFIGVPAGTVCLTAGSDEALRAVIDTSRHGTVIMGVPGYTHFEHYARLRGMTLVQYPIGIATRTDDLDAALRYHAPLMMAGALVYLCSPNNPTGDVWPRNRVRDLALEFPESTFLVDEAYVEFVGASMADMSTVCPDIQLNVMTSAILATSLPNIVVSRTMSKAFGLAGQRIGYLVAAPQTIRDLRVAISPKAVIPGSARVALAVLANLGHYLRAARDMHRNMRRILGHIWGSGWVAYGTAANFFLVYAGDAPAAVAELQRYGIQVRDRSQLPGLSGFVRVTAGNDDDTDATIAAFDKLTIPPPPFQRCYTSKGVVAAVKTLTREVCQILRSVGIEYWAQSGTMLGIYRHGGMIPTDDDADLAYRMTQFPPQGATTGEADPITGHDIILDPLSLLVGRFAERGLTLQRNRTDAYWQVGTNLPGCVISPIHVDVFSYVQDTVGRLHPRGTFILGDPRFRDEDPSSAEAHCNTKYAPEELFPLNYGQYFYDVCIPMPARTYEVLARSLGADFMMVAKARYQGGLVCAEIKDYSPA